MPAAAHLSTNDSVDVSYEGLNPQCRVSGLPHGELGETRYIAQITRW